MNICTILDWIETLMRDARIERSADINVNPALIPDNERKRHLILGDQHGNTLKLINTLIAEGILPLMSDADYGFIRELYNKEPSAYTVADINKYMKILRKGKIDTTRALTLLGDLTADRGKNDLLTLLLMQILKESGLELEIILSNHDAEFFAYVQDPNIKWTESTASQRTSLTNMRTLFDLNIAQELPINKNNLKKHVKQYYISKLKYIGYSIDANGDMSLFTHAPVGLDTVRALANKLKILYKDDSQVNLINTINQINQRLDMNEFTEGLSQEINTAENSQASIKNFESPIPSKYPFNSLLWNRLNYKKTLITQPQSGQYKIKYVHGHIGQQETKFNNGLLIDSHTNLDEDLGKTNYCNKTNEYIKHYIMQSNSLTPRQLAKMTDVDINIFVRGHVIHIDVEDKDAQTIEILKNSRAAIWTSYPTLKPTAPKLSQALESSNASIQNCIKKIS